jgi:hypothetical protein
VTQAEAARRLGLTPQALGVWAKRPGAPVSDDGGRRLVHWPDFPRWRDAEITRQVRTEATADTRPGDLEEARARKMAAEAELAELALAKARGQMVTVGAAVLAVERRFMHLRARILAVPSKGAYRLVGLRSLPQATKQLREIVADLLPVLSTDELAEDLLNGPGAEGVAA